MTQLPWTDLHEHALQNSDAFQEAVDHLLAGRSITGAAVTTADRDTWTQTQLSKLRRFCYDQKLTWEWSGMYSITITDRLTGDRVNVLGYRELGSALSSLFCERMIAIALRYPHDLKRAASHALPEEALDPEIRAALACA